MPCSDITETIIIKLDKDNKLTDYSFLKRACGGNIGQKSFLLKHLIGYSPEDIINLRQSDLIRSLNPADSTESFLAMKHISVIQFCFQMYYGDKENNPKNAIKFYSINYDENGIELEADVKLELDVKKIDPCNNCGCGL